jgi:hypothetical protein
MIQMTIKKAIIVATIMLYGRLLLAQIDSSRFFVDSNKPNFEKVDSIRVFFIGGSSPEKYKFYYEGKLVFSVKVKDSFNYTFRLNTVKIWNGNHVSGIQIYRKGRFGIKFRDTGEQISYEPNKYLIIKKNPFLKNRIAVDHYWSDTKPPALTNLGKVYHKIN